MIYRYLTQNYYEYSRRTINYFQITLKVNMLSTIESTKIYQIAIYPNQEGGIIEQKPVIPISRCTTEDATMF